MEGVTVLDWIKRQFRAPETRSTGSGYTAQVIAARQAYITGQRGVAELTATVQAAVSLWENAFAVADVEGTTFLDRFTMGMIGRAAALRGEAVLWITGEGLIPVFDWTVTTRMGRARAYQLSLPDTGGGRAVTALAPEVLHLRLGSDVTAPWAGTAPLRRAQLTGDLLAAVEQALKDVFTDAPIGSQVLPMPDGLAEDMAEMRTQFRGRRGSTLIVEGVAQATAGGFNPQLGQRREDLSPDLSRSMTAETLDRARGAVLMAYGILPAMLSPAATGPVIREGQRHLVQYQLQPLAEVLAEEASEKLGAPVRIDVQRPLQAFDTGNKARSVAAIVRALAEAKEAGIDPGPVLKMVDWREPE